MPYNNKANITAICEQLLQIAHDCNNACKSSFDPCLNEATEASFGNQIDVCQSYITHCLETCSKAATLCLPTRYPLNVKYHNSEYDITVAALVFEALAALAVMGVVLKQHLDRFKGGQASVQVALGQVLGLVVGVLFTLGIKDFFPPRLDNFSENNPRDIVIGNQISASIGLPVTLLFMGAGGVAVDKGVPLVRNAMVHAYRSFKAAFAKPAELFVSSIELATEGDDTLSRPDLGV